MINVELVRTTQLLVVGKSREKIYAGGTKKQRLRLVLNFVIKIGWIKSEQLSSTMRDGHTLGVVHSPLLAHARAGSTTKRIVMAAAVVGMEEVKTHMWNTRTVGGRK